MIKYHVVVWCQLFDRKKLALMNSLKKKAEIEAFGDLCAYVKFKLELYGELVDENLELELAVDLPVLEDGA